jgi:transcriptional regulator with XRE-family HTH domain
MNRIREIMIRKRMRQHELSRLTGIAQSHLSEIINDEREIYLKTAKKIAKALGYSVDYIWPD